MKKILIVLGVCAVSFAQAQQKKTKIKIKPGAKPSTATVKLSSTDSISYAMGMSAAGYYKSQGIKNFNSALVKRAFEDVMNSKTTLLTTEQSTMTLQEKLQTFRQTKINETKLKGQQFLAQNKTRQGVVTLPSGLQYEVIKAGSGEKPKDTSTIKAHYILTLTDGTEIESSRKSGEPIQIKVNQVIPGWIEAMQLMPVGSRWKLYIPSELAYGDRDGGGPIPGGSTLVFDVELLQIVK
ncbi:FKBP-type peptidyl-prolyl cis-trans isomerase [soil metagenome]